MIKKNIIIWGAFCLSIVVVFRNWFTNTILSSGDWIYYFPKTVKQVSPFASWDSRHFGLGSSTLPILWLEAYAATTAKFSQLIGWVLYERIFWYYPYLVFSSLSSYFLYKKIFPKSNTAVLASVIFLFNTYSLMLVGGGQMGIGLAYSFTPFAVLGLINLIKNITLKNALIFGLLLSILLMFDLRILYVFLFISLFIIIFLIDWFPFHIKHVGYKLCYIYIIPGFITLLIHSFWILPLLLAGKNPVGQFGEIYSSNGAVKFFSFAFLENSISLLHPNWPENLFGKVYFMRAEFLFLPILAFSSLLFIEKDKYKKRLVTCFALLGLVGAFLAKGANDPFGGIYIWLFNHIPGFVLFRDPTKWYQLIALSYMVLIPFSIESMANTLTKRIKIKKALLLLSLCFVFLFAYTIRFVFSTTLSKTFHPHIIPAEYITLSQFIENQNEVFRTLWVPMTQTYGYFSEDNPSISSNDFFNVASASASIFNINSSQKLLQQANIKYVIVPYDVNGEIFLNDRKYDGRQYKETINALSRISWLRRVDGFDRIAVFENSSYVPLFSIWNNTMSVSVTRYAPYDFKIHIDHIKKGERIIFSEGYNKNWVMKSGESIHSDPYNKLFNSFIIKKDGEFSAEVMYASQQYVWIGLIISSVTLFVTLIIVMIGKKV